VAQQRSVASSLPKDSPPPLPKEPLDKLSNRQPGPSSSTTSSRSTKHSGNTGRSSKDPETSQKNAGITKRSMRGRPEGNRDFSEDCDHRPAGSSQLTASLRSSQSQTPDDEDSVFNLIQARRTTCKRHGSTKASEDAMRHPLTASSCSKKNGTSHSSTQQSSKAFRHFKRYDHSEFPTTSTPAKDPDFMITNIHQPQRSSKTKCQRKGEECSRPRSASIGNHLPDADVDNTSTFPHNNCPSRRHHTLDGYHRQAAEDENTFYQSATTSAGAPSSHSVSSKSEKSSRSSQSPSVENLRHGK
jgi:hypothetical protein